MKTINELSKLCSKQYGLATRSQLITQGFSKKQIENLLKNGILTRKYRGIYELVGTQGSWRHRACLATLASGKNSYLSHESVLQLHGLLPEVSDDFSRKRRPDHKRDLIHIISRRPEFHTQGIFFHRSSKLDDIDKNTSSYGIRHVSIERAIIDCAQQLTDTELDTILNIALSKDLIAIKRLLNLFLALRSAPGREKKRLRRFISYYMICSSEDRSESSLENRVRSVLDKISNEFVQQYEVSFGNKKYRLDFALPAKKIAVEVDGFAYHSSRTSFDNDRRRQNDLINAGWKIIRVTAKFKNIEIKDIVLNSMSTS